MLSGSALLHDQSRLFDQTGRAGASRYPLLLQTPRGSIDFEYALCLHWLNACIICLHYGLGGGISVCFYYMYTVFLKQFGFRGKGRDYCRHVEKCSLYNA